MRRKLKDTGGLTMVEMLCATAILVLLCLMMNTCLGMAVKNYQAITAESEAELLVSSLSDALADKLRYCVVTVKDDGSYQGTSVGEVEIDGYGRVTLTVQTINAEGAPTPTVKQLLPNGAYGASGQFSAGYIGRYTVEHAKEKDGGGNDVLEPLVTCVLPPVTGGTPSFQVHFIVKDEQLEITREADFTVRCLNPVKKEGDSP